jgi:hypothetical protein
MDSRTVVLDIASSFGRRRVVPVRLGVETPPTRRPYRFAAVGRGHPDDMGSPPQAREPERARSALPSLVFVWGRQDGASRKMESLVAWVKVTQRKRLRVLDVDAELHPGLARKLAVRRVPSLVLVKDRRVVGRLEGRATGRQIDELIRPHLT